MSFLLWENTRKLVISSTRFDLSQILWHTSKEFEKCCDEHGITHEVTTPYTPRHNGLAERINITILNMVSILKEKSLPRFMWGEAAATAEEKWTRRKPTVSHLSVFCDLCYSHIPQQRTKLQDKSKHMILVCYDATGAYKLYDSSK